jgi:hypothetical protein
VVTNAHSSAACVAPDKHAAAGSELELLAVLVLDVCHVSVQAALRPRLLVTLLAEVIVARVTLQQDMQRQQVRWARMQERREHATGHHVQQHKRSDCLLACILLLLMIANQ